MARLKVGWYEKLLTKAMSAVMVIVICFKPGWCKQTIVNISADVALVYNSYHVKRSLTWFSPPWSSREVGGVSKLRACCVQLGQPGSADCSEPVAY